MPKESSDNRDRGSRSNGGRDRENRGGSYAPEWLKRSRDDVPPNDQPLPKNPVVEAIMGVDNPGNQKTGQPQQTPPDQPASGQAPVESEG